MQVILLEKVANLGNLGDVVKVKDGYARNFLIPTRAARRATEAAIKEFEVKRAELERVAADKLSAAQALGEKMSGRTVHITQKAGVDGRLFGSVTNNDVAEAMIMHLGDSQGGFNPAFMMFDSGSRGSRDQIRQLGATQEVLVRINEKGERVVVSPEARQRERENLEKWAAQNCRP